MKIVIDTQTWTDPNGEAAGIRLTLSLAAGRNKIRMAVDELNKPNDAPVIVDVDVDELIAALQALHDEQETKALRRAGSSGIVSRLNER